jgi:alpha-L-fucosidase
MKLHYMTSFVVFAASLATVQAVPTMKAEPQVSYASIPEEYAPYIHAEPEATDWFEAARFGVFMHWGPYSLAQVPASWGRHGPRPAANKDASSGVPFEEYDALYKEFNPVDFDADAWIRMVKDSGAKYFIFTTKHHDGFCMFDAKNTDYKITNTPFGRDVTKELADACHKYGIKIFWYYSQPDWHHPDCMTEDNARYRQYMFEHLEQLLTEYGEISGVFFDGLSLDYGWWDTPAMLKMMRTLQPGIIINRRWGWKMPDVGVNGDYDNPEQEVGHFEIDRPWEACLTMATAWSWTGNENIKTFETCLRLLIQCAGSGGNLALNTGPTERGAINPPEMDNYKRIGAWLGTYGESIYGTTGGPYKPAPWGVATRKENKVYLHVLANFVGEPVIELPALPVEVTAVRSLNGASLDFEQADGVLRLTLDGAALEPINHVVELTVAGDALDIPVIESVTEKNRIAYSLGDVSTGQTGRNSLETLLGRSGGNFVEGKKHKGWWAARNHDKAPWLMVDFEREVTFNAIALSEQMRNCSTRQFVLEYALGDTWELLYEGQQIGMDFSLKTANVTASKLRIRFLKNADGLKPNLLSFDVFKL